MKSKYNRPHYKFTIFTKLKQTNKYTHTHTHTTLKNKKSTSINDKIHEMKNFLRRPSVLRHSQFNPY
jgi:hypothetical protein